eukprot:1741713-Rhodomonas_salina.1
MPVPLALPGQDGKTQGAMMGMIPPMVVGGGEGWAGGENAKLVRAMVMVMVLVLKGFVVFVLILWLCCVGDDGHDAFARERMCGSEEDGCPSPLMVCMRLRCNGRRISGRRHPQSRCRFDPYGTSISS